MSSREVHFDLPRQLEERPISPEHLHSINMSLKNITDLPTSTLLTVENLPFTESVLADAAADDTEEPHIDDPVGREWVLQDTDTEIRVARYNPEFQKELGAFDYTKRFEEQKKKAHGHIGFRKEVGPNSLSGMIFFLGNGDELEEVQIRLQRIADPEDKNAGFLIQQFAGMLGLNAVDAAIRELPEWEGDLTASYSLGRSIANGLSELYHDASGV